MSQKMSVTETIPLDEDSTLPELISDGVCAGLEAFEKVGKKLEAQFFTFRFDRTHAPDGFPAIAVTTTAQPRRGGE